MIEPRRLARAAIVIGALLLALAVGLIIWDTTDDAPSGPPVISGEPE